MSAKRPLPPWWRAPRRRFIRMLKRRARPALNRYLARHSEVGDPVVFAPGTFPWEKLLEDHWQEIRREAEAVLALRDRVPAFHEVSPDQYRISQEADWKTFWLHGFGERSETCCRMCPVTDRVVSEVPGLETAFFSMMAPGTHVIAHRGVFKGIINCHLGLLVPDDAQGCRMRVGKEFFHWEEGRLRIFDDTRKHEVWNDTDQERVVLMIQFRRPLRAPGRQVRDFFLQVLRRTPYLTRAMANQRRFEAELASLVEAEGRARGTEQG
ncbi:MAG: aspartyl/asparaginyl beta-hydroxylase domain-containing protein [Myxococcota bacterium]